MKKQIQYLRRKKTPKSYYNNIISVPIEYFFFRGYTEGMIKNKVIVNQDQANTKYNNIFYFLKNIFNINISK